MFLVDTSIWTDYIGRPILRLSGLLFQEQVLGHPFVLGEILLGNLRDRVLFEQRYQELEMAEQADDSEVLMMISDHGIFGTGIGYVDAHLLASALLSDCKLLTRDKRLATVAVRMGIGGEL